MMGVMQPVELFGLLREGKVLLIDVREPEEFAEGSIEGSQLIPLGQFEAKSMPPNPQNLPVVIHCRSGGRSSVACKKLLELNPQFQVYNLEGGILAWQRQGLPVKQG